MKPSTALALRQPEAAKAPRRRKALVIARVSVLSPKNLTRLRMAQQQGLPLSVSFDGFALTITEARDA